MSKKLASCFVLYYVTELFVTPYRLTPTSSGARSGTGSKHDTPKTSKKPLFRPPSPSSSDDEVADELTAHIAKLNVSSDKTRSPSPPRDKAAGHPVGATPSPKGKGRALESSSPAPVMYPVLPTSEEADAPYQPAAVASPVRAKSREPTPAPTASEEAAPTQEEISKAARDPPDDRKRMISEECDLNLFDKATGTFMLQEAGVISSIWLTKREAYTCWLTISGQDGFIWVSQPISADMPLHFVEEHCSVIISFTSDTHQFTWLMRYKDNETYLKMNQAFTQGIFEAGNGAGTWSKLKPDEQKYNQGAYNMGDVEMEGAEPWNPEEDEEYAEEDLEKQETAQVGDRFGEEELYSDEEEEEEEEEEESEEEEDVLNTGRKKPKNSLLTVGHKGMSFVVRGDMIGVFENQKGQGKKLKFMTNISGIKRPGSKSTFVPSKVMLHDQDQAMILSDPLNPNAVYRLDLTTGSVTDEWKISDNVQIANFMPDSKYAQQTGTQTFVGSSRNAIFRVDPRLNKDKLVDSSYKDYKSPFDFTAGVTTADGKLAFATNKGEIKLFDRLGIRAKTAFAQLGREIKGIDVTADGRYIVATTKEKLLFLDTSIREGKNAGRTGCKFNRTILRSLRRACAESILSSVVDAAIPADDRPQVHALTLRPEHAAYVTGGVNFTPAKFNIGEGLERTIVTSTGPYIVTWNFRAVKAGKFTQYKIKRYEEDIVADNFTWGGDKDIVSCCVSEGI